MKKWLIATCACAMVLGATATDVKIATREWVIRQFAAQGIHVSSATTVQNTNGTFTVSVPFTSDTITNCVELSLTFTDPSISSATPVVRGLRLRAAAQSSDKLEITLTNGAWKDAAGNEYKFNFEGGYTFTWPEELPEVPSSEHVCEFDANCNCTGYQKKVNYPDDYPEQYRLKTMDDFDNAAFGNIIAWIDTEGWPDQTTAAGKTRYWITDTYGNRLNLEQIGKTDLWRDAVAKAQETINERLRECCEAYYDSAICDKQNPQHAWENHTCGQNTWRVCQRNSAHNEGTERHAYANGNAGASGHYCLCGNGPTEGHTFATGERTQTANGWTAVRYCTVQGCGYVDEEAITHTHHHVNCQPCDVDGCNEPCSCGGNHVGGEATQHKGATCVCDGSEECNAKPPASDITKHSGWMPCGQTEDPLEDNADGKAAGAHCQCQCFTFGHDARTQHVYAEQEEGVCVYYDEERHRRLSGNGNGICTRCGQRRGELEQHQEDPEKVTYTYKEVSGGGSVCERKTKCIGKGCGYEYKEDVEHSPDSETETYISIPPSTCRHKVQCSNCKGWITEDGSHERDASNGCKC